MLADWKSRDLTQEDCADLAAYGNIPSTDNLPLVSGNQVVYFFISPYGSIQANRQYTKERNTAFVPKVWELWPIKADTYEEYQLGPRKQSIYRLQFMV